jgi:peptidoglycan/xylan/chitin deacetylase (PgdA/CDA1 family)
VPILDRFVFEHPDFSDHGAKGVIALTGYQGILGYRTNDEQVANAVQEQKKAAIVIQRLKETGWSFASHGWGHLDAIKVSYDRFVQDTKRWKREVEPLIGTTSIYIYPFGSRVETDGDKFKALINEGFHVLCSVGPAPYLKWQSGVMMMDRRHIDGIALKTQRSRLLELFDANDVLDPIRLKLMKK